MKKGICWSTLPPEMGVAERFVLAAKAGFQAIEPSVELEGSGGLIRYDSSEADLKQALKMARDNGLTYCSLMGGGVHQRTYPIVDDDAAVRQKGLDSVRRLLEIAATLETGALLFVPHWVGDKVRYDRCYERTLETMRKLAPEAERLGVTLAIENVWNKFLLSPIEFARIIDEVGSPAVQAYFDVGNVLVWGYPHHWIEILGKRICRVHVKDFRTDINNAYGFAQLLNGSVNWPAVMRALRGIGYDGWVTAEVGRYAHFPIESTYDTSTAMDRIFALR